MPTPISRDQLRSAIDERRVVVVDALPATPYVRRHIPSALNLVEEDVDAKASALLPDRGATIVTYSTDAACGRGEALAERLESLGYTHVRVYQDGIEDWTAAGLPVETGPPPTLQERRPAGRLGADPRPALEAIARAIIDCNRYLTLGTADESGLPWVSPVWYAGAEYREFFWVSSPYARHSSNVATRPQVSIVIFDSQAPIGTGQAVYMSAVAEELAGADLVRGIGIFSRRSEAEGARAWTREDVQPLAPYRLYRATASEHSVLDPAGSPDRRTPVTITKE